MKVKLFYTIYGKLKTTLCRKIIFWYALCNVNFKQFTRVELHCFCGCVAPGVILFCHFTLVILIPNEFLLRGISLYSSFLHKKHLDLVAGL